MKPVILCYEKCTTCKKALKWVEEKGCEVQTRPIKVNRIQDKPIVIFIQQCQTKA